MIGSCLALFLAQRRPDWTITLLDEMPEEDLGRTTKASWAWLNANNKQPKFYQSLNQLGVQAWKRQPHLRHLVSWLGSLVRFEKFPEFVNDGGYPAEGPLTSNEIKYLEPLAQWNINEKNGYSFFFPDEGCVDPSDAIKILRRAAKDLGVEIKCGHTVTNVIRDEQSGYIRTVESLERDETSTGAGLITNTRADLVVAAAGCGSKASFLGGLPLVDRPGRIEYAQLTSKNKIQSSNKLKLRRILVDPERSSHVLQRKNGDVVAGGGGNLEFGGSESTLTVPLGRAKNSHKQKYVSATSLLGLARELAPSLVDGAAFTRSCQAVRPMPQDGLPVVGYSAPGIYSVVTHSGITLGLLLTALAAAEITESISFELLDCYRPTRFAAVDER